MKVRSFLLIFICVILLTNFAISSAQFSGENRNAGFELTFTLAEHSPDLDIALLLAQEWAKIGISVNVEPLPEDLWVVRTIGSPLSTVPLAIANGYDVTIASQTDDNLYFRHPYDPLFRNSLDRSKSIINFDNDVYTQLVNSFLGNPNLNERNMIFAQIESFAYDQLPVIPLYSEVDQLVYPSGRPEPSKNLATGLSGGKMGSGWADISRSIFFENTRTLNVMYSGNPLQFTPHVIMDRWGREPIDNTVSNMIFQGLYERDQENYTSWTPLIAEAFPEWNADHTVVTIQLRNDVFFSDNTQLTAYDVVESYRSYLTPKNSSTELTDEELLTFFDNTDSIQQLDQFTVEFTFSQSYIYDLDLFTRGILPIHIWDEYQNQTGGQDSSPEELLLQDFIDGDSSQFTIGSGPYFITKVDNGPAGGIRQLKINNNYWHETAPEITTINLYPFNRQTALGNISRDEIDYILPYQWDQEFLDDPNVDSVDVDTTEVEIVYLNLDHPIFGTGLETPLGLIHPNRATEAATYIRKAMSHLVPRQLIVDVLLDGSGKPAATPFNPLIPRLNTVYAFHEYELGVARNFMQLAGFDGLPIDTQTADSENQFLGLDVDSTTLFLGFSVFLILSTGSFLAIYLIVRPEKFIFNSNIKKIVAPLLDDKTKLLYLFVGQSRVQNRKLTQDFKSMVPTEIYDFKFLLHPVRLAMMKLLFDQPKITSVELKEQLGINWNDFRNHLKSLRKKGLIEIEQGFVDDALAQIVSMSNAGLSEFKELTDLVTSFLSSHADLGPYLDFVPYES